MTTSTTEKTEEKKNTEKVISQDSAKSQDKKTYSSGKDTKRFNKKGGGRRGRRKDQKRENEYEQKIIDLARVTRVMAGGKRMRFRACVAIGDQKGKVGLGLAKGVDVSIAINKAVSQARKNMINVPIVENTIPHKVVIKEGASHLMFKPAPEGTGVKAGGIVRMILELAGVPNVSSKIFGSTNKVNNAKTTLKALSSFKADAQKGRKKKVAKKTAKTAPKAKAKKTEKKVDTKKSKETK